MNQTPRAISFNKQTHASAWMANSLSLEMWRFKGESHKCKTLWGFFRLKEQEKKDESAKFKWSLSKNIQALHNFSANEASLVE